VEHHIGLPLFFHVAQIPESSELCGQWFGWLNFKEGRSFQHLPSNECNENQQPTKMKLVALVLCFATIFLQLVDEVAHPDHLHPFEAFSYEVNDEPCDLRWSLLPDELSNDQLAS
jgi:hypothetical protein